VNDLKDYAIFIFFIGILAVSNLGLAVNVDITESGVVTNQTCIDDHHLLVTRHSVVTEGTGTTEYEVNQTIYCEFGCENNRCQLAQNELFSFSFMLAIAIILTYVSKNVLTRIGSSFILILLGMCIIQHGLVTTMDWTFERIPTITIIPPGSTQAFVLFVLLTMIGIGNLLLSGASKKNDKKS